MEQSALTAIFFNWPQVSLLGHNICFLWLYIIYIYNQQIVITLLNLFFNLSSTVLLFGVHANNKKQGDDIT